MPGALRDHELQGLQQRFGFATGGDGADLLFASLSLSLFLSFSLSLVLSRCLSFSLVLSRCLSLILSLCVLTQDRERPGKHHLTIDLQPRVSQHHELPLSPIPLPLHALPLLSPHPAAHLAVTLPEVACW